MAGKQPSGSYGIADLLAGSAVERYWESGDPAYWDREGAESFGAPLSRAEAALKHLAAALPSPAPVYVFSQGEFIQAVKFVVDQWRFDDRGKMQGF